MSEQDLGGLRSRAIDALRAERWADVLALQPALEADTEYWLALWGPALAVAAHHQGRPDARDRLEAVIGAGFHDVATHAGLFASSFAREADWPDLLARMEANRPPPPVELVEWPTAAPVLPMGLDRLDAEGEARLAERLPAPGEGAEATALALLAWVTSRWRHTGTNHAPGRDANLVLDLVAQGQRFACREYTLVLTQALNAVGIPARPLALLREHHYTGMGTGHAVTEAWLDDAGAWVVLDGQNGATWRGTGGRLLGVVELQRALADGRPPPFVGSGPNYDRDGAAEWLPYFRHCSAGGTAWRSGTFVPLLEGRSVVEARPLVRDAAAAHPDLAELSTSVVDRDGPAVLLGSQHPYVDGWTVVDEQERRRDLAVDEALALAGTPGRHAWQVSARTRHGVLRPAPLVFVVA